MENIKQPMEKELHGPKNDVPLILRWNLALDFRIWVTRSALEPRASWSSLFGRQCEHGPSRH